MTRRELIEKRKLTLLEKNRVKCISISSYGDESFDGCFKRLSIEFNITEIVKTDLITHGLHFILIIFYK